MLLLSGCRRTGASAALLVVGLLACGGERERGEGGRAATAAADPHRCALPNLRWLAPDTAAVRCAEWFVARNGYTGSVPVADSTQIAHESVERTSSVGALLAQRRNSLARTAAVICTGARKGRQRDAGYTVAFLPPGDTTAAFARAVTMNTKFAELRVEHVTFLPRSALRDTAACRPLAGLPQSLRGRGTA